MERIRALPANVGEEEAIELLSHGFAAHFRPRLRRVANVYLPFQCFEVAVENGQRKIQLFAIDRLAGNLDPYAFDSGLPEMTDIETRNHPRCMVSAEDAQQKAIERARRLVYQQGFFRLRELKITLTRAGELFYVPYWVGFYGEDQALRIAVIDAVRRRTEGAKVVEAVKTWLRADT